MNDLRRTAPSLNNREFFRWMWRQLTSMRTALLLLLLLAVGAVPGSLFPQRGVEARQVEAYFAAHPTAAPILDTFGMFDVYGSVWFSAIYLLLMVSLIGCVVPRLGVYSRALRSRPPKAPKNLHRLPASDIVETDESVAAVMTAARRAVGRARIDIVDGELRAERGYLREAGNLVFHFSLLVVLVGVAASSLWGYRGSAIVTEGSGFSNSLTQYDEFASGAFFDVSDMPPFSLALDDFDFDFRLDGPQRGAPRSIEAAGTYVAEPGGEPVPYQIEVNDPLTIDGTSIFLVGQGYAPVIKVTDSLGNVAFNGPVPFLPSDGTYTSTGVLKVPGAKPEQLGFQGFFLPTAVTVGEEAPVSAFPAPANPLLGLFAYHGDLGLDDGLTQSVYVLDKDKLTQFQTAEGEAFRLSLSLGQVADLPDGSTVQFVGLRQFTKIQISSTPWLQVPLWGISIGVLGLMLSLTIRPRRIWVRARREGSRTVVEIAALDRVPRDDLPADLDDFVERLKDGLKADPSIARRRDDE